MLKLINIKFLFIFIILIGCNNPNTKKIADVQSTKSVVNTPSIMCDMCVNTITKALLKNDGVQNVTVNLQDKTTTIEYDNTITNIKELERIISDAGYDANEVRRNIEAYEQLPACCKDGKVLKE